MGIIFFKFFGSRRSYEVVLIFGRLNLFLVFYRLFFSFKFWAVFGEDFRSIVSFVGFIFKLRVNFYFFILVLIIF